ncbi:hypothetical protein FJT64_014524 [Amphibalanus amphitrite]|uniref:Uncharacterized protein n=1 Tax=Amphibalanus amphitrite TaxID=1232801 RepID=A0A6A4V633_AMPAM|nr:hypothetical protein FJT64_014524 [Amphibalanus amphitrite]
MSRSLRYLLTANAWYRPILTPLPRRSNFLSLDPCSPYFLRFSGDAPDLTYSKLPCEDGAETTALTGSWSRDTDDPDEVTDPPPAPSADQDWLERAMRQEGLL